jgi:hypothetical protein
MSMLRDWRWTPIRTPFANGLLRAPLAKLPDTIPADVPVSGVVDVSHTAAAAVPPAQNNGPGFLTPAVHAPLGKGLSNFAL